jgi:hypothetical protein
MKTIALMLAIASLAPAAQAQGRELQETTPQQQLMTTCRFEAEARELKAGDKERFVGACLVQGRRRLQEVLAQCRIESRSKSALERPAFMNECARR